MLPAQLDIFEHSRDTMLRNDVVAALERRDARAARYAWRTFAGEFALDATLAPLAVLVDALERATVVPLPDHDAVREARRTMADSIEPAARRSLGDHTAARWLAPLWRELATRAASLPFVADRSDDHAAALCLRGGDCAAAVRAVAGIESWRRIPAPLSWMAQARYRLGGLDDAWALMAELAWLASGRFGQLVTLLADPVLDRLRREFEADFEANPASADDGQDLAWFPAWVLTRHAALAGPLWQAQPGLHTSAEQALRLMLELLGLERQGRHRDLVTRRKVLRDLQPSLYAAYMATR
ncbi:MAG: hypothetical protein KGK18_02255 [Burkholderiales bacterium]|nr:hypothetical protein [Burkholderiales bacterium]